MPHGKPNILVIWGDDIGISNLSCYSDGTHGLPHPQHRPDCRRRLSGSRTTTGSTVRTAGRAVIHLRVRIRVRTGLTRWGLPGRRGIGLRAEDPTIAYCCSRRTVMPQDSSERTTWATGTSITDDARLRRVLRQPLPPERRGRARTRGLPPAGGLPEFPPELRPPGACCTPGPTLTAPNASRTRDH